MEARADGNSVEVRLIISVWSKTEEMTRLAGVRSDGVESGAELDVLSQSKVIGIIVEVLEVTGGTEEVGDVQGQTEIGEGGQVLGRDKL